MKKKTNRRHLLLHPVGQNYISKNTFTNAMKIYQEHCLNQRNNMKKNVSLKEKQETVLKNLLRI